MHHLLGSAQRLLHLRQILLHLLALVLRLRNPLLPHLLADVPHLLSKLLSVHSRRQRIQLLLGLRKICQPLFLPELFQLIVETLQFFPLSVLLFDGSFPLLFA